MSPTKGPETAILAARQAGLPIKLAGKMRTPEERRFFEAVVQPLLGPDAEYLGEVDHDQRVRLLHGARALLFPIAWDEPFGLVMAEALACGVPVIAMRRGSVPEVIDDGVTGAVVDTLAEMAAAVERVSAIAPGTCRAAAERRFSPARMADDYVRAYRAAVLAPSLSSSA
jgi:glycosyltransferase involved in cell wall biosynthesis